MMELATRDAGFMLQNLLAQAGWRSRTEVVLEAVPHAVETLDREDVAQTLENLQIPFSTGTCREVDLTEDICPAIVFPQHQTPYVVTGTDRQFLWTLNAGEETAVKRQPTQVRCELLRIGRYADRAEDEEFRTVSQAFEAMRPMMPWLLLSSLLVNVLGLLAPVLIMAIYDRVIPSGSVSFLMSIAVGVGIVLLTDFALRIMRSKAIAHVGRQAEQALSLALFAKLMVLPLPQIQKSGVDQQISRFRQFEALREIFTGQVMTSLLDLPFVLIFLALLMYLAPPVGLLTMFVAAIFVLHGAVTIPVQTRLETASADATRKSRALVEDAVLHQKTIVDLGLSDTWLARSAPLIENAEAATRRARRFQTTQQSFTQTITSVATVLAIVMSASAALAGSMSFGALIAVIALVSKVIAPIQALHSNAAQVLSFRQSKSQADRVLALAEEMELGLGHSYKSAPTGSVSFNGVTHKPDPLNAPVVSQTSLRIEAGELVLIMGSNISGRTAILDLIDGLAAPLGGTIELDGVDIRQIARDELRRSITYATYKPGLFYGTIAQNFRLAAPRISDDQIKDAITAMGLQDHLGALQNGIETRLTDGVLASMSLEFARGLSLARSIARLAPFHLFSEPTNDLGPELRACFKSWIAAERGHRTILIATSDRSFLAQADRFIFLESGRVIVNDKGDAGLKKMNAALNNPGG